MTSRKFELFWPPPRSPLTQLYEIIDPNVGVVGSEMFIWHRRERERKKREADRHTDRKGERGREKDVWTI